MNVSKEFDALLSQSAPILNQQELLEFSQRYQIVLLKGFLGDVLPKRFDSYFFDHMRWMRNHEISHYRLGSGEGFGTQKLSENNVNGISNAIQTLFQKKTGKQIIIVSHSKGGIDTLETLLRRKELIGKKVAGWIAFQAPFWGTPVANWATENRLFNPIIEPLLGGPFKGDRKVAASMTAEARTRYMINNAEAVKALSAQLNILNFATRSVTGDASLFRPLRFAIDKIAKVPNDGLLPTQSEILKVNGSACCPYIEATHIDHIFPVFPLKPDSTKEPVAAAKEKRIRIFTALLKIWMINRKNMQ